jgi:hypothetical protein
MFAQRCRKAKDRLLANPLIEMDAIPGRCRTAQF